MLGNCVFNDGGYSSWEGRGAMTLFCLPNGGFAIFSGERVDGKDIADPTLLLVLVIGIEFEEILEFCFCELGVCPRDYDFRNTEH